MLAAAASCLLAASRIEEKKKIISTTTVLIQGILVPHLDYLSNLPPDFPIPNSVPTPKQEFYC